MFLRDIRGAVDMVAWGPGEINARRYQNFCCALFPRKPVFYSVIWRKKCLPCLPAQIGRNFSKWETFSAKIPGAEALFSKIKTQKRSHCFRSCKNVWRRGRNNKIHHVRHFHLRDSVYEQCLYITFFKFFSIFFPEAWVCGESKSENEDKHHLIIENKRLTDLLMSKLHGNVCTRQR